jgi:hypothetical protein
MIWFRSSALTTSIVAISMVACVPRRIGVDGGASQIAEVKLGMPAPVEFEKIFGDKCKNVKLKSENPASNCPAVVRLLAEVRLNIKSQTCTDGGEGTVLKETRPYGSGSIVAKIKKGCVYDVLVEAGNIAQAKVYYANTDSAKGALNVPSSAGDRVEMRVVLEATADGVAAGFPRDRPIVSEGASDLAIDVQFGRRSPAPSNPGRNSQTGPASPAPVPQGSLVTFAEVNPILRAKCSPCHALGGKNPLFVDNEMEFSRDPSDKIPFVESDEMPPVDSGKVLTAREKALILKYWQQREKK